MILTGKRLLATIITAAVLCVLPCMAQQTDGQETVSPVADTQTAVKGTGTAEDPYLIDSPEGLEYMALLTKDGASDGTCFELSGNVVLNSPDKFTYTSGEIAEAATDAVKWTPVGTSDKPFKGSFDGNGFYITGLYCDGTNSLGGLFGVLEGAEVKNVNLDFALVETRDYAGLVAAKLTGESSVSGCVAYGSVIGKQTVLACVSGGIAGTVDETSSISDCCVYGAVTGANAFSSNVGGIAGLNKGAIEKCTFSGRAFGVTILFSANVGGIAGTNNGTLEGCLAQGSVGAESAVVVSESNAGGIAGYSEGEISQCKNECNITGYSVSMDDNISTAGGICGYVANSDVYGCENNGSVTGETGVYAGGIAGLTVAETGKGEHKIYQCLNNGRVTSEYGVAGGVAARISASGYVTDKNEIVSCVNTAFVDGTECGGVAGAVYTDGAAVAFTDSYYPAGLPDVAKEGTTTVAEAGFVSGTAFDGLDGSVWAFESGKKPYIIFADLAKNSSVITAEGTQTVATGTQPSAQGVGTMLLSKQITSGTYDVIVRFTGDEAHFAPKPVVIKVIAISADDAITIVSVDTQGASVADGKLSGTVTAKLYGKEAGKQYVALTSVFVDGVFANVKFGGVTSEEGMFDGELSLPEVSVSDTSVVTVKVMIVESTDRFKPVCEDADVAIG